MVSHTMGSMESMGPNKLKLPLLLCSPALLCLTAAAGPAAGASAASANSAAAPSVQRPPVAAMSVVSPQSPAAPATEPAEEPAEHHGYHSLAGLLKSLDTRNNLAGNWWGGLDALQDDGILPDVTLLQAASENFSGGLRTNRIDWRYRLDASLTLDTEKLFNWKGGTAYVDLMAHGGQNPANNLVGELQAISAIDQNPDTRLDQLWYQQRFWNGALWFKLGRIDATYDLDHIRDAQPFLNGSFGFSPSIFVYPSYPFSAWGGEYSWRVVHPITLRGGIFDGNTSNTLPAVVSPDPLAVENPYGLFFLSEESVHWQLAANKLRGELTAGQWFHTGAFELYSGGQRQDAHGFYGYLDQTLWKAGRRANTAARIGAFTQYAWADDRLTEIDQNISGGIRAHGLIPGRKDDDMGIAATWAHISPYARTPHSFELSIETFYSAQVTPWLSIQPDLQYIVNPGGTYSNALVATIQVGIQF